MKFAVGFDFDHTLGVDNHLERNVLRDMLHLLAVQEGVSLDWDAVDTAIDASLRRLRSGELPLEEAVASCFATFVDDPQKVAAAAAEFRDEATARASRTVEIVPGASKMLADLRALGVPVAILTNGWSPLQEAKVRACALDVPVLVSETIGALKPAREAFAALGAHFGLPLEALWYVGDDPRVDAVGATVNGLTAVWFDWEAHVYPPGAPEPAYVIHKLEEFVPLVQGHVAETANLT